jgi:hypothetical protein
MVRPGKVKERREGVETRMNLTLISAIALLVAWIVAVFVAHVGSGPVHLLYAAAVVLLARRVVAGARGFLS